ncbi:MAG: hypothetical protein Q9201_001987 [Fulgogasparrea decipioides]
MATNLSLLTHPYTTPNGPDFDICDRRYGLNLDIPQCDVAVDRLGVGSARTDYRISDQEGPRTLPLSVEYEVAGPHLPQMYGVVPDTIASLAGNVINECVGRAGRVGGFATMDIGKLIDYVVNPSSALGYYPPSSAFLTVSVTAKSTKKPSPGDYDPIIADTLSGAARDAAMRLPASGAARRTLVQRSTTFRTRAMRMSTGGLKYPWWGTTASGDEMSGTC